MFFGLTSKATTPSQRNSACATQAPMLAPMSTNNGGALLYPRPRGYDMASFHAMASALQSSTARALQCCS